MVGANGFTLDLDSYDGCLGVLLFKVKKDLGRVRVRVCVCAWMIQNLLVSVWAERTVASRGVLPSQEAAKVPSVSIN